MKSSFCVLSPDFDLFVSLSKENAAIKMVTPRTCINTATFPATYDILQTYLPTVLETTCFNDLSLPFHIEVKKTETGHLFEHVLLDYLCQEKVLHGADSAVYQGVTSWNWKKEPQGTFHIQVNIPSEEGLFFINALQKSCTLVKKVVQSSPQHTQMVFNQPSVCNLSIAPVL
jgi:hypothetical protein